MQSKLKDNPDTIWIVFFDNGVVYLSTDAVEIASIREHLKDSESICEFSKTSIMYKDYIYALYSNTIGLCKG